MLQLESEKKELLKELRLAESRTNQVHDEEHIEILTGLSEVKGNNSYRYCLKKIYGYH